MAKSRGFNTALKYRAFTDNGNEYFQGPRRRRFHVRKDRNSLPPLRTVQPLMGNLGVFKILPNEVNCMIANAIGRLDIDTSINSLALPRNLTDRNAFTLALG